MTTPPNGNPYSYRAQVNQLLLLVDRNVDGLPSVKLDDPTTRGSPVPTEDIRQTTRLVLPPPRTRTWGPTGRLPGTRAKIPTAPVVRRTNTTVTNPTPGRPTLGRVPHTTRGPTLGSDTEGPTVRTCGSPLTRARRGSYRIAGSVCFSVLSVIYRPASHGCTLPTGASVSDVLELPETYLRRYDTVLVQTGP